MLQWRVNAWYVPHIVHMQWFSSLWHFAWRLVCMQLFHIKSVCGPCSLPSQRGLFQDQLCAFCCQRHFPKALGPTCLFQGSCCPLRDLFQDHLALEEEEAPPKVSSFLVSSLAVLTTWATSISCPFTGSSCSFDFPVSKVLICCKAFPSSLLRSLAVVLPALVSLEPAFSKASSKSDIVADTIFLAVLQALASFSWGSGSSLSSSSLMALPLASSAFSKGPLAFSKAFIHRQGMAVSAEELHDLFQVLILRLKLNTNSAIPSAWLCWLLCANSGYLCIQRYQKCRGTLSRSPFQTGDASPALLGCTW